MSSLPVATRYLLLIVVLPMVLPNGLHARPNGVLAFLTEGELKAEANAALAWARERYDVVVLRATSRGEFVDEARRPRPLNEFAVLWWHCQMRSMREMGPWRSDFTKEPTLRAVTDFLVSGGGLYLSGSGARYLNYLGLEPYYVNLGWCSAGNHVDCGYERIGFVHWVRVYDVQAQCVVLKDTLAEGFAVPERLRVTVENRLGSHTLDITPEQLSQGIELSSQCRVGEHLIARYELTVSDISKAKQNPPGTIVVTGVERMRGPEALVTWEEPTKYVQAFFRRHRLHGGNFRDPRSRYAPPIEIE